jgi:hypothetical protein
VFSCQDFIDNWLLLSRKLLNQGYLLIQHQFESFTVATMTCFTITEYLCCNVSRICYTYRKHYRSVPLSWLIAEFVARIALQVPLVEQELLTILEYLRSFSVLVGKYFVDHCLSFCLCPCPFGICYIDLRILMAPFGIVMLFLLFVNMFSVMNIGEILLTCD